MQYSPKLKKAMEQIKNILKDNDIAAFVLLHDQGFSEYVNHLNTSYSCAIVTPEGVRFRLKTAEVGKERAHQIAQGTYNMVTHFSDMLGKHAMMYMDAQKMLADRWGGEEGPSNETSHEQQNN